MTGTGTNWTWRTNQTATSFTSGFNSGMATGGYGIRVSGTNGSGREGNTSNWVDIIRDISSPSIPVGLNLVCNTNGSVSASWSPAADVGCGGLHSYPYWARLSTDPNFGSSSVIYSNGTWPDGWTSGITKSTPATAFGPGVTVYGKVRSRDTFDQQSAWAVNDSCVIPTAIPSPIPGTPVVNASPACTSGNGTWTWSAVSPAAASYDLQRQGTGWDWISNQTATSFTSNFNSGFPTGNYGVRVAGKNGSGQNGNWSNWANISRDISAPSVPSTPVGTYATASVVLPGQLLLMRDAAHAPSIKPAPIGCRETGKVNLKQAISIMGLRCPRTHARVGQPRNRPTLRRPAG